MYILFSICIPALLFFFILNHARKFAYLPKLYGDERIYLPVAFRKTVYVLGYKRKYIGRCGCRRQ